MFYSGIFAVYLYMIFVCVNCAWLHRISPQATFFNSVRITCLCMINCTRYGYYISLLFAEIICKYFNESLEKIKLPDFLKLANFTPAFKKVARTSKNNYRPVSILPILSKLFERLISK